MNNNKWNFSYTEIPENLFSLNIDRDIIELLVSRGINTKDKITRFLNPSLNHITSPFEFSDVEKASKKIFEAVNNKEKICIYGDYDVDGITSVSLMYLALKKLGANVTYHIPLRDDGYGLNCEALEKIKNDGSSIIISVDCGISSVKEVSFANSIGLTVIITDHHEINNELPPAFAIVNPKRDDNSSPFKYFAGVGIAFMLLLSIYKHLSRQEELYEMLDIVAIGTVADIVPLLEENRIFVYFGLDKLKNSSNLGLRTLLKKIYPPEKKNFDTSDIGFRIAPLFNAAGRLEDANRAVELLTTDSPTEADIISMELFEKNEERKSIQKEIFEKVDISLSSLNMEDEKSIIAADSLFHHGVIGIVASKLVDKYYKPSIIMEIKNNNIAVASARSIAGFNLIEALNSMKELFVKYGGHEGAAGFSIEVAKIEEFKNRFNLYISKNYSESIYNKEITISSEIIPPKISFEFYSRLSQLEPFGFANKKPLFALRWCTISNARLIGQTKDHLMFDIIKEGYVIRNCVWFSHGFVLDELKKDKKYDIAFQMEISEFKGKYYIKPFIEDIRISDSGENRIKYFRDMKNSIFPVTTLFFSNFTPEIGPVKLEYNEDENICVFQNKKCIGWLTPEFSRFLRELNFFYKFSFTAEIISVTDKENGYSIKLKVEKNLNFETFSTKDGSILSDIKTFLIGDFEFNSIQKYALSKYFKSNVNPLIISQKGRGIDTIFLTAAIYEMYKTGKKSAFIYKTRDSFSEFFLNYFDIYENEPNNLSDYNFIAYYEFLPLSLIKNKKYILFFTTDQNIQNCEKICDTFILPENIEFEHKAVLTEEASDEYGIYSKYLPFEERKQFIKNMNIYKKIKASKEFMALLK